jgi:hypothetical protein
MATRTQVEEKKHDIQIALLEKLSGWIEEADTLKAVEGVVTLALAYRYLDGGIQPGGAAVA